MTDEEFEALKRERDDAYRRRRKDRYLALARRLREEEERRWAEGTGRGRRDRS